MECTVIDVAMERGSKFQGTNDQRGHAAMTDKFGAVRVR